MGCLEMVVSHSFGNNTKIIKFRVLLEQYSLVVTSDIFINGNSKKLNPLMGTGNYSAHRIT